MNASLAMTANSLSDSSTATRRAWGDYVSIFTAQVALALLTALGLALSARLLGPKGYGMVALFLGVVQFFFIVGVKWSFSAVIKFGREALIRDGFSGRVFWAWASLVVGSLLLCSFGFLVFPGQVQRFVGMPGSHSVLFILSLILTTWAMATVSLLQMQGKMRVAAWTPVAGRIGFIGLLAGWTMWNGWQMSPVSVILFVMAALAVQAILGSAALGTTVCYPVKTDWGLLQALTSYSLPLILASSGAYVSDWIDLYFIRRFQSYADVGVYQVAYQALIFVTGASMGVGTLAFPILTAWRTEDRQDRVTRYAVDLVPQLSFLWAVCVLGIGLIQAPLFPLCFGSAFASSGLFFSVLLIGAVFHLVFALYLALFFVYDRPGTCTAIILVMAAVNILGDWWLVPRFGAIGAAVSTSTSFAVSAWLSLRWGNQRIGVDRRLALVPPCVVAVSLLAASGQGLGMRLAIAAATGYVLVWWARASQIFSPQDVLLFDHIQMPRSLSWLIKRLYLALSSRGAKGNST